MDPKHWTYFLAYSYIRRVSLDPCPSPDLLEEAPPGQSSCKFQEQKEKSKVIL